MRKGDIEVLGCRITWTEKQVQSCVHPRESDSTGVRRAEAGVVEIHNVVCVFESEPFVGGEDIERAEGGGATDYGFVAAKLGYGCYVIGCEVESWCNSIEASDYRVGVNLLEDLSAQCQRYASITDVTYVYTLDLSLPADPL